MLTNSIKVDSWSFALIRGCLLSLPTHGRLIVNRSAPAFPADLFELAALDDDRHGRVII
jgi:hypothetical protein